MQRRELIGTISLTLLPWPRPAAAQQQPLPIVGFFRSTASAPFAHIVAAFRQGLAEGGLVEGQSVVVEYSWAENQLDRLPELAADLVRRQVAVIVGNSVAVEAARAATQTIPIVFVAADDPVKSGLVRSLNSPGGNLTGVTFFAGGQLGAKRVELLLELVPQASMVAVLSDPTYPGFAVELPAVEAAIHDAGRRMILVQAAGEPEFEAAFAKIAAAGADALLVAGSPLFTGKRKALVALAARHAIPAFYDQRDHVEAGGLISYGASFTEAYRQAGIYAAEIVKGAKPAELPVLQPSTFELVINLKTAASLDLTVPESIMLRADDVIE